MTRAELVFGFGFDVRVHATEESLQTGLCRVAEIVLGLVDVLERLEEGVVVVGNLRHGSGLEERREQDGAGAVAAVVAVDEGKTSAALGLRKGCGVRAWLLVAAEQAGEGDRHAGLAHAGGEPALVEVDDEQAIFFVGGGTGDDGHPLLEERVGGDEAAGLAIDAGRVVAVVAEVGGDEDEVRRGVLGLQVLGELVEIDYVLLAVGGVDDGMEVDERIMPRRILVALRNRR